MGMRKRVLLFLEIRLMRRSESLHHMNRNLAQIRFEVVVNLSVMDHSNVKDDRSWKGDK